MTIYTCHICGALLVGSKCGSCGHTQCDECPACAPQETRKQLIERISQLQQELAEQFHAASQLADGVLRITEERDELESYKHNADHALNLAIGEARLAEAALAGLRAVNERLVQDVKRHMEREEVFKEALEVMLASWKAARAALEATK